MSTVLFQLKLPRLFEVVRRKQLGTWKPAIQYHVNCDGSFTCYWPMQPNGFSVQVGSYYSENYHCPFCGQEVNCDTFAVNAENGNRIPVTMDLSVVSRRNEIDVIFKYDSVIVDDDLGQIIKGHKSKRTDIVRFDFKQRRVLYIRRGITRSSLTEVIPDFKLPSYFDSTTPFYWLRGTFQSLLVEHKEELKAFAAILKKTFLEKLSKRVGYSVPGIRQTASMASNIGVFRSLFDTLVFRMAAPDGPSISEEFLTDYTDYRYNHMEQDIDAVLALTRTGTSWISALIKVYRLKNNRLTRQLLQTRPFWAINVLSLINAFTDNIDRERTLVSFFKESQKSYGRHYWQFRNCSQLTDYLLIYRYVRGTGAVVNLVTTVKDFYQLRDSADIYFRLSRQNRKAFWAQRIKAKDVHNALVSLSQKEKYENKHIQQSLLYTRLEATIDGYQFTVPKETHELVDMGVKLHNCVATYSDRVVNGLVAIVAVSKNDELQACIEVTPRDDGQAFVQIHQAKLACNHPVREDPVLNKAVIDWADKVKLNAFKYNYDIARLGGTAI
ncbi:PcfJ domain-containing protein [uncultured Veillonella sp.]|uniref:PcfJ domain-containing protein n=1 Tax=uncultured Veillonella sp. TaxID=159268 RepID=UPI00280B37B4|nr:PcfJ domain-containing protein [uncultured Veillonella sp.]